MANYKQGLTNYKPSASGSLELISAYTFSGSEATHNFTQDFDKSKYSEFIIVFTGAIASTGDLSIEWDEIATAYYGTSRTGGTATATVNAARAIVCENINAGHTTIIIHLTADVDCSGVAIGNADTGQSVTHSAFGNGTNLNTIGIIRNVLLTFAQNPTSTSKIILYGLKV